MKVSHYWLLIPSIALAFSLPASAVGISLNDLASPGSDSLPIDLLRADSLPLAKIPFFNLHDFVSLLTSAICVLLVIYQLFLPKTKPLTTALLALFFLSLGTASISNILLWNSYISIKSEFLKNVIPYIFSMASVAKGVFLYLYVASLTQRDFALKPSHIFLAIPLVFVMGMLWTFHMNTDSLRFIEPENVVDRMAVSLVWHVLRTTSFLYSVLAVVLTIYYHNNLKEYYSSYQIKGPMLLSMLTVGFSINWAWALATDFFGKYLSHDTADSLGIADNYITLFLLNAIFIYSFVYSNKLVTTKTSPDKGRQLPAAQSVDDELTKIRMGMEVDKLYLKNNLNIEEFSKRIGLSYRDVSSIINKHFQTNFYEFVNLYRVNKAKELLENPDYAHKTILEILLESGFNSKSAFHRFFKRYVGTTANEYRKKVSNIEH